MIIPTDNSNATRLVQDLVKTNNDLPTLTKKQEKELIEKYKDNRTELNNQLILHNSRLVYKMASKYTHRTLYFDDLIFNGLVGLAIAANRFDIARNIKFSTYATPWIKKYLLSHVKYNKNYNIDINSTSLQNEFNLESSKYANERMESYLYNSIEPTVERLDDEISVDIDKKNLVGELFEKINMDNKLSSTDKKIADELFLKQTPIKTICEKYDLNSIKLNRIKYKILNKFKQILKNDYNVENYSDFEFA